MPSHWLKKMRTRFELELGRSVGAMMRAPLTRGLDSQTQRHNWVDFCWFSTLLREDFSPAAPVFPSPHKPTFDFIWVHVGFCVQCPQLMPSVRAVFN